MGRPTFTPIFNEKRVVAIKECSTQEEKEKLVSAAVKELSDDFTGLEKMMDYDYNQMNGDEQADAEGAEAEDKEDGEDKTGASMEEKMTAWKLRQDKYVGYAKKGKVDKLTSAVGRQEQKLQKAKDRGKSQQYINYKQSKVDYTNSCIKMATMVKECQCMGLEPYWDKMFGQTAWGSSKPRNF